MRLIALLGFALSLAAGAAHGDATLPSPATEVSLDGAVIDLREHRQVRTVPVGKRCGMDDGPLERARSLPAVKQWAARVGGAMTPVAITPHHLLLNDPRWSKRSRSAVVDLVAGKFDLRLSDRSDLSRDEIVPCALVERADGSLLGLLDVDGELHELRLYDPKGQLIWRRPITDLWGDSAAVLVDGDRLFVATFNRISTGSALFAFDVRNGELRWRAEVVELNVAHSEYMNDVSLERVGGDVVMRGFEAAGCYLQTFELATGKRTFAKMPVPWAH